MKPVKTLKRATPAVRRKMPMIRPGQRHGEPVAVAHGRDGHVAPPQRVARRPDVGARDAALRVEDEHARQLEHDDHEEDGREERGRRAGHAQVVGDLRRTPGLQLADHDHDPEEAEDAEQGDDRQEVRPAERADEILRTRSGLGQADEEVDEEDRREEGLHDDDDLPAGAAQEGQEDQDGVDDGEQRQQHEEQLVGGPPSPAARLSDIARLFSLRARILRPGPVSGDREQAGRMGALSPAPRGRYHGRPRP